MVYELFRIEVMEPTKVENLADKLRDSVFDNLVSQDIYTLIWYTESFYTDSKIKEIIETKLIETNVRKYGKVDYEIFKPNMYEFYRSRTYSSLTNRTIHSDAVKEFRQVLEKLNISIEIILPSVKPGF